MEILDTKYQVKVSVVRQETVTVEAHTADEAYAKIVKRLQRQAEDEQASLEHFVVCSVEVIA